MKKTVDKMVFVVVILRLILAGLLIWGIYIILDTPNKALKASEDTGTEVLIFQGDALTVSHGKVLNIKPLNK